MIPRCFCVLETRLFASEDVKGRLLLPFTALGCVWTTRNLTAQRVVLEQQNTLVYARSALNARSEAATTDYRYQRHVQAPGFIRSLARASLLSLLKSKVVACFRARDELISTNID